jgi:hypothetical protein
MRCGIGRVAANFLLNLIAYTGDFSTEWELSPRSFDPSYELCGVWTFCSKLMNGHLEQ